ncbi:MAG: hypothetical protein A2W25_15445 [candidate division Zixibacteria bacterium RBG_16_53_22]|nr:MAG: hypothetical protein A2W25_15445 [candidate division Zixibacteria bacterium RBG_16_53_22]
MGKTKKPKAKRIEVVEIPTLNPKQTEAETAKEIRARLKIGITRWERIQDYHIARGELRVERAIRKNRAGYDHAEIVYWIEPKGVG